MPDELPPLEYRMVVANINSESMRTLIENDAIPESYYTALDLLNVHNPKVHNVLMAALSLIPDAWAQMLMGTLKKGARNQFILASRNMLPSFALTVALRRRSTPGLAVSTFYQLGKGMPPSNMNKPATTSLHFFDHLDMWLGWERSSNTFKKT